MTHPCLQSNMRNTVKKMFLVLLLLVGVGILLYPKISDYVNRIHSSSAMQSVSQKVHNTSREDLERQLALARGYNEALLQKKPFAAEYEDILNFEDGIMGSVRIPAIGVELPIYHGIGSDVLSKGAGHMPQTAFPIGGVGNHSVLTGHTGLPSAEFFTDLSKLRIDDIFYVSVAGKELAYRVDQILTVLPTDNSALAAVAGMDYCTLVTCTPYGINSHRLLVRGHRAEEGKP